jgi:hypothetical protein
VDDALFEQGLKTIRQRVEMERERYADLFELASTGYLLSTAAGDIQRNSGGQR